MPPKYENKSEKKSYLKTQNYFLTSTKKKRQDIKSSLWLFSPQDLQGNKTEIDVNDKKPPSSIINNQILLNQ